MTDITSQKLSKNVTPNLIWGPGNNNTHRRFMQSFKYRGAWQAEYSYPWIPDQVWNDETKNITDQVRNDISKKITNQVRNDGKNKKLSKNVTPNLIWGPGNNSTHRRFMHSFKYRGAWQAEYSYLWIPDHVWNDENTKMVRAA